MSTASGHILVCFAVKEEAAPFLRSLPPDVETLITGMGAAAAERALTARLHEQPQPPSTPPSTLHPSPSNPPAPHWSLVLTCGFAGGLHPALRPETVVFETDDNLPLRQALLDTGGVAARFHCASHVITTAAEKTLLRERTGADAIDMESAAIRRLCRERGIPSATVRVISDTAHEELPLDFNAMIAADGKLDLGKLALALLRRPHKIPALLALGRRTKSAAERLAAVLRVVLPP
ncbi:MAG: hypothetical protein HZA92_07570 [Verrucomicrobia bacterium]|nr:hypothetical protein [Verrucomicrobiota bacterium]